MKKQKPVKLKTPKMTPKKKKYYAELENLLNLKAHKIIIEAAPYKCFIVMLDKNGDGVSRASPDFTMHNFKNIADHIVKLKKLDV